jgi:hypothetical protein
MNLLGAVRKYRKKDWWNFSSRLFTERATPSINLNQKHSLTCQTNSAEESFAGNESKAVKHPKVITKWQHKKILFLCLLQCNICIKHFHPCTYFPLGCYSHAKKKKDQLIMVFLQVLQFMLIISFVPLILNIFYAHSVYVLPPTKQ